MHSRAQASIETDGTSPELTVAKHQLRDWIETQLASLTDVNDTEAFARRINDALKAVGFTPSEDGQNLVGTLGAVQISSEPGLLVITTALGILCRYDESAYGYKRLNGNWQRAWESEQNNYSAKQYAPQHLTAVHVWQRYEGGRAEGPTFVMTLGNAEWCSSRFYPVYYRVWRIDPSGPKLLLDGSEGAYLSRWTYNIVGSIAGSWTDNNPPVDVLIEFTERSVDVGVHNREAIRHFLIERDQVRRVDPVALSPRDFVDEWLTRPWNESVTWSASPALREWHRKLHDDFVDGQFSDATRHCHTPDLWQVTARLGNAQRDFMRAPELYFLVRWRPPYHFAMVNISNTPWPLCTEDDRDADEWRTLFSIQEWRQ